MNKAELKEQAELVINPINVVTQMDFKLTRIDSKSTLWFNRGDEIADDSDKNLIEYYYMAKIKSHDIGLTYYPISKYGSKYKCIQWKHGGVKGVENYFDTELELCVFLKQPKFKIK
jgi:hypothetical protein